MLTSLLSIQLTCMLNFNLITAFSSYHPYVNNVKVPGRHRYHGVHDGMEHANQFVNEWTVAVDGGEEVAQLVAMELGYIYGGQVSL